VLLPVLRDKVRMAEHQKRVALTLLGDGQKDWVIHKYTAISKTSSCGAQTRYRS